MNTAIVWKTQEGAVGVLAATNVDVVFIDFQKLEAGSAVPVLSEAQKALLKAKAPELLEQMARYVVHYRCDNCQKGYGSLYELNPVRDLEQRVAPGEPRPVGECPHCGAVVHPVEQDWWPVPRSALDRHCLSGRINLSPEVLPMVDKIGLDGLLTWFEATRGVAVGETRPIGEFGLQAYYGFDPSRPNGECFFINITVLR